VRASVVGTILIAAAFVLSGCYQTSPKVAPSEQVGAERRAAMAQSEGEGGEAEEGGAGEEGGEGGPMVSITAVDIAYEDVPTEIPAGGVTIELVNEGSLAHNVVVEQAGDETVVEAEGGETATGSIELDGGQTVTIYCDIANHRAAGMEAEVGVSA